MLAIELLFDWPQDGPVLMEEFGRSGLTRLRKQPRGL
jgi:hypothetical protein